MKTQRSFVVVRVLEQFEGPLLEVVRSGKQLYLRKWASSNVWLYTKVTQGVIDRYMRRDITLLAAMASYRHGEIEVEIDSTPIHFTPSIDEWHSMCQQKRWLDYLTMRISALPKMWLPARDARHVVELEPEERS